MATVEAPTTVRFTWNDAVNIVEGRRMAQSELVRVMSLVRAHYNAEYILPAPAQGNDSSRPLMIQNLVNDAIDNPAQIAASIAPGIFCPQVEPDKLTGKGSAAFADIRRRALGATLYESKWELINRRLFRHIGGYGMAAMLLIQDERSGLPRMVLRDPLCTYAEAKAPEDLSPPANVGFIYQMSASAIVYKWPTTSFKEYRGTIDDRHPSYSGEMWDVLEWVDHQQTMIGILGPSSRPYNVPAPALGTGRAQLVDTMYSKPGMPMCAPCVVPQIITLDKIISRAAHMSGKMDTLAYLWDLDIQQTKKGISPDRYVLSRPNEEARILSNGGHWLTGESGETNLVSGAQALGELRQSPDQGVFQRLQALQAAAMGDGGMIGPQVGNTAGMAGSLRTGRGINALAGVSIDPKVQEMQMICAEALHQLGPMMLSMYDCYWPDKKYTMFTGWAGDQSTVKFTPAQHFRENKEAAFSYAIAGADASAITVGLAQLKGAEAISTSDLRRMHPWIADDLAAGENVLIEKLENMALAALGARAAQGGVPPEDMAAIIGFVRGGMSIELAMIEAQKAAQARQAQQTPPEAPEAQPGLGNPDEGAGAGGGAPAPGGPPNVQELVQRMFSQPPGGQQEFSTSVGPRDARLSTTAPA